MYREIMTCCCVSILLYDVMTVNAVPVPSSAREGAQLSVYINDVNEAGAALETLERNRRHVSNDAYEQIENEAETLVEDLEPVARRQRRSAAFFLSAAIKLCEDHPNMCRTVSVRDKDVNISIQISDE